MASNQPRRLAGRYEVRSLIGRGGMAQVHLGFDMRLSRVVAIKMLRIDLARDMIFQTRFRREAQAAASLNHPNIVAVYDTGEEEVIGADGRPVSVPYIVMEYVEGHTVKELLSDGTPVPIDEAVEITSGVLAALEYSHASGLVHRDIKPGNIMLTGDGTVKVMDFGIARAMTDSQATMTQTNAVVGTAQYLSPEQARGEKVDERSDIYSAGCVLFELLTGKPPFTGDSAVSVAYQHVSEIPPVPSSVAGDVPESLDRVVLKAMAKDPDGRYRTSALMRVDLERAGQGLPITAPDTQSWTAVTQPVTSVPDGTAVYQGPTRAGLATAAGEDSDLSDTSTAGQAIEEKPKKSKTLWIWLLVLLAAAMVAGVLYLLLSTPKEPEIEEVEVPALAGMTVDQAEKELTALNLVLEVGDPVTDPDIEADLVVSSNPPEGTIVDEGSTVTVALSSGPGSLEIPDMEGWTQTQVRKELEGLGFKVGEVKEKDVAGMSAGGLVSTDPAMGSVQPVGTTIDLTFASGYIEVPVGLEGAPEQEVLDQLADLGLSTRLETEYSDTYAEGSVIRVEPTGLVKAGDRITVTVSLGPEPAIQVPTGMEGSAEDDVVGLLSDLGLRVTVKTEYSDKYAEGAVVSVSPTGEVEKNAKVTVIVSKGPEPTPEPTPDPDDSKEKQDDDTD